MTVSRIESLEKKLVTLIKESERLYEMLQECVRSREKLQEEIAELREKLEGKPDLSDDERR
jgi:regulator of replication initiation timing